jgi:beta-lactamase superfamily II metal-dependent hydrolase
MARDRESDPTDRNESSIAALLMWGKGDGTRFSHISLYCAGDMPSSTELWVAEWAKTSVTSMKLSHHGAIDSTSKEVLDILKPSKIVVSSGNMYGHPRKPLFSLHAKPT